MKLALLLSAVAVILAAAACAGGDSSPAPTETQLPLDALCPLDDIDICELAATVDDAIRAGDLEAILAEAAIQSATCAGNDEFGPCVGLVEGTVVSGRVVGIDPVNAISLESEQGYLDFLQGIADTADASASDDYGDGAWRLVAIIDESPDQKVLVTTTIGLDPIYELTEADRRVFLLRLQPGEEGWQIGMLLASPFIESNLTGLNEDGSIVPGWAAWGEG